MPQRPSASRPRYTIFYYIILPILLSGLNLCNVGTYSTYGCSRIGVFLYLIVRSLCTGHPHVLPKIADKKRKKKTVQNRDMYLNTRPISINNTRYEYSVSCYIISIANQCTVGWSEKVEFLKLLQRWVVIMAENENKNLFYIGVFFFLISS